MNAHRANLRHVPDFCSPKQCSKCLQHKVSVESVKIDGGYYELMCPSCIDMDKRNNDKLKAKMDKDLH